MPLTPTSSQIAAAQCALVAAGALAFGYLVAEAVLARSRPDRLLLWGLAFPGVATAALALEVLHMATRGEVLSRPWLVRALVAAAAALLVLRRRRRPTLPLEPTPRSSARAAVAVVLVATAVWGVPLFWRLPLSNIGDMSWHVGSAAQLLNGETTPSASVTGIVPNYYPWLWHVMTAVLASFTPGGHPFHALGAMQTLQVAGVVLSLFALGVRLTRTWAGGTAAALLAGVSGGFGFLLFRKVDLVLDPRAPGLEGAMRYLGDLVYKRSYHVAFSNLAPPFPRDVALALLVGFLLLLASAVNRGEEGPKEGAIRSRFLVAAGFVLGLAGLAGGESFIAGGTTVVVFLALPAAAPRLTTALRLLLPALGVYALWTVPLAVSYLRLGGFVNTTIVAPVDLTYLAILVAWGVATPLAVLGAVLSVRRLRREPALQVVIALLAATGLLLVGAELIPRAGEAFLSLSRRHRYWPLLHLGVALTGAVGAAAALERVLASRPLVAVGAALLVAGLALPSPIAASVAMTRLDRPSPVLAATLRGKDTVLTRVGWKPGERCVAAVPEQFDARFFSYTGYRLVRYQWGAHATNTARIRWRDIFEHIPNDVDRIVANDAITSGLTDPAGWRALVDRYGVGLVVTTPAAARSPAFAQPDLEKHPARDRVLVRVDPCA